MNNVLGVRRWRELVADRKNGRTFFDRPKPTVGCSANRRRRRSTTMTITKTIIIIHCAACS